MKKSLGTTLSDAWYTGSAIWLLLWPVSLVYRALALADKLSYQWGLRKRVTAATPVVVVGNITAGGTGKTPLIIWLARVLCDSGWRPGIVCRGYRAQSADEPRLVDAGSDPQAVGDEAVLLAKRTGCPVAVCADRAAAVACLEDTGNVDIVLSDDGLQHWRLGRQCEIAVIDGTRGLGNGHYLPAGPLRENPVRLHAVDAVVINGAGFEFDGAIRASVRAMDVVELSSGQVRTLGEFSGQRAHAIAAIGNPHRFFDMLRQQKIDVIEHALDDHAQIGKELLESCRDLPVIMTEKDAVKCASLKRAGVWYVRIELDFSADDGRRLIGIVQQAISGST